MIVIPWSHNDSQLGLWRNENIKLSSEARLILFKAVLLKKKKWRGRKIGCHLCGIISSSTISSKPVSTGEGDENMHPPPPGQMRCWGCILSLCLFFTRLNLCLKYFVSLYASMRIHAIHISGKYVEKTYFLRLKYIAFEGNFGMPSRGLDFGDVQQPGQINLLVNISRMKLHWRSLWSLSAWKCGWGWLCAVRWVMLGCALDLVRQLTVFLQLTVQPGNVHDFAWSQSHFFTLCSAVHGEKV